MTFSDHLVHHTFTYDGGAVAAPPAGHPGDFAWGRLTHDRAAYGDAPGAVAVERFVRYNWQGLPEEKAERFGTLVDEETVAGEEFVTAYDAYDYQGNLRRMAYPSGQAVEWAYQDGGTLAAVSDGTRAIFSNLAYAAHGAVAGMRLGDAATGQAGWGQAFDAARLWPVRIVAGTTAVTANTATASGAVLFGLDYDSYEANGNIAAVTRTLRTSAYETPYTMDFAYTYDRLNRLAGCAVAGAEYNYAMDEFGNILGRAVTGGGGDLPSAMALAVDRGSNRLAGAGYAYDVLGNLVEMPAPGSPNSLFMTYLDQGHIGTLTDAAGDVWKYYYDADGKRRIKAKTAGGAATRIDDQGNVSFVDDHSFYFYEGEDLICQQDAGALVARITGTDEIDESAYGPKFLLLDHLGSTRAELVFTESGGVFSPVIQEYYDLMPYGEVIDPPTTQESVLFTGKSRDIENGLDFFGARYFGNFLFRWTSSDQPFADSRSESPLQWNLYVYSRMNPLRYFDSTGRAAEEKKQIEIHDDRIMADAGQRSKEEQKQNGPVIQLIPVGGSLTVGGGGFLHLEANVVVEVNLQDIGDSKLLLHGQAGWLFGGLAGATVGLQGGMAYSQEGSPSGLSEQFETAHLEAGMGLKVVKSGSLDLGADSQGNQFSISGMKTIKPRVGGGAALYSAMGTVTNRTYGSPSLKQALNWVKSLF